MPYTALHAQYTVLKMNKKYPSHKRETEWFPFRRHPVYQLFIKMKARLCERNTNHFKVKAARNCGMGISFFQSL